MNYKTFVKKRGKIFLFIFFLFVIGGSIASPIFDIQTDTLNSVILNSSDATNYSSENLTVYTDQDENSSIKLIYNWYINSSLLTIFNMPFEGGSNDSWARDYAQGSNVTSDVSDPSFNSSGGYDGKGAFEFDGNDALRVNNPVLGLSEFTICAWAKKDSHNASHPIFADYFHRSFPNPPAFAKNFALYENSGDLIFIVGNGAAQEGSTITGFAVDTWYHVCGVFNGNTDEVSVYLDGENNTDAAAASVDTIGTSSFASPAIGGGLVVLPDLGGEVFWNGDIDDVVVYNKSFSKEQINALYNSGRDLIVSEESTAGENWSVCVFPNNGSDDGDETCSSELTILASPVCGDGVVEGAEVCDLTNLSGETCVTQGYDSGTLSCTANCTFNTDACANNGGGGGGGGCSDECDEGEEEASCVNGSYVETRECGDYDSDSCLDWSDYELEECSGICEEGSCVACEFNCTSWSECVNDEQTRICDSYTCEIYSQIEVQSCANCAEDWLCNWSACVSGDEYSYASECVDLNDCGTELEKPDKIACSESGTSKTSKRPDREENCSVNFTCTGWGECESSYTLQDLVESNSLVAKGIQKRYCTDGLSCAEDYEDVRYCDLSVDIEANLTEKCGEECVEIYEKDTGKLVSRLKKKDLGIEISNLSRVDISLMVTEFVGYCDYCYDELHNYDETGVDCGGPNCPECVEQKDFFNWLSWFILILWVSVIFSGIFILWTGIIYVKNSYVHKTTLRFVTDSRLEGLNY